MPIMDGYTATQKIRDTGQTVPIVALTAHAMSSERAKCINVGCTDFATKPIQKQELLNIALKYTSTTSWLV